MNKNVLSRLRRIARSAKLPSVLDLKEALELLAGVSDAEAAGYARHIARRVDISPCKKCEFLVNRGRTMGHESCPESPQMYECLSGHVSSRYCRGCRHAVPHEHLGRLCRVACSDTDEPCQPVPSEEAPA